MFALWGFFLLVYYLLFTRLKNQLSNFAVKNFTLSKTIFFALILSVLFVVSVVFSNQIPLSLEKLFFYLFALAIFIFFSLFIVRNLKLTTFFYYLSIVTLIMNILVSALTFYPDQEVLFSGMNLLVRSYGHNHYVAYLLLVIPVFWWQLLVKDQDQRANHESNFLTIILLISSYLLIILSLARLVLVISLLQLILIFLLNRSIFASFSKDAFARVIVKTFIFMFVSISLFFLFLSIPFGKHGESVCPLIFSKKELCKPLAENDRLLYWQRAWEVLQEKPLMGVGLKNFNFASRRFPLANTQITSYAHNIFLHNLAESGLLVGGFFIFFFFYLFYRSLRVIKKKNHSLHKFLLAAAAASWCNAMFDYDWHFFVIFSLTLIFFAIILQSDQDDLTIKTKAVSNIKINMCIFKTYYLVLAGFSLLFITFDLAISVLYKINRQDLVIKYLPFMNQKVRLLWNERKLTTRNFENLWPIYQKDAEFLYRYSSVEQLDAKQRIALQLQLADVDPFLFISSVDFASFDFQTAAPLAEKYIEVVQKYHFLNNTDFLDYFAQKETAQQFFDFANQAYLAEDWLLATNYYVKTIFLNEFLIETGQVAFLSEKRLDKLVLFLHTFREVKPSQIGQRFFEYMELYRRVLLYLFTKNQMSDFFVLAESMFTYEYNSSWFLWRDLLAVVKTKEEQQRLLLVHQHFKDMSTWKDFLVKLQAIQQTL
jgi:O-antigen ligase